jgi:ElaB/YqjD/DUF883 family membrane-anchored ribosome-binding protein
VVRFNAEGPAGLIDRKPPGCRPMLDADQRRALAAVVEAGPIPAARGVVRWRLIDLAQWVWDEFALSISKQTLSRELRALGYRKLSARPRHHAQAADAIPAFEKTFPPSWRRSARVYADRLHDARGKVVGVARDAAASYAQRIKDAVASAGRAARATSHDLTSGASTHGTHLQEGTRTMAHSTRSALSSIAANPFAFGGIAAVVGLVAGSLLPVLEEDEHALGGLTGKVRTTGRDLAQDVIDRGGRVASETLDAVKGSTEAHGLSADRPVGELLGAAKSGGLAASVKQMVHESVQAGKDSA